MKNNLLLTLVFAMIISLPSVSVAENQSVLLAKIVNRHMFSNPYVIPPDILSKYCTHGCRISLSEPGGRNREKRISDGVTITKYNPTTGEILVNGKWRADGPGTSGYILARPNLCVLTNMNRILNLCEAWELDGGGDNTYCHGPYTDTDYGLTVSGINRIQPRTLGEPWRDAPITTCDLRITPHMPILPTKLDRDTPISLTGGYGAEYRFMISVPTTATYVVLTTEGDNGDADIYLKHDEPPTFYKYDYRGYRSGSNERIEVPVMSNAGVWYVLVRGYREFSNVKVTFSENTP